MSSKNSITTTITASNNPTIINCTPHDVHVHSSDGTSRTFVKSEHVARVGCTYTKITRIDGVDINSCSYSETTGLPLSVDDTYYIVSRMVRDALPSRTDLLVPGDPIRDDAGRVIGCKGLCIY